MSISIKPDSWHVKDGNGQYRGTAIFSSTLPSEAHQIVTESIAEINAVKATIPQDYTELSNKVDGLDDDVTDLSNAIEQKQDATNYVTLSGTIVTQTGADNTMYLCGELAELTFTAPATGQTAIRFSSGTTPTVATFTNVTWLNGFDPSAIEASKTYEINILNGLGCAAWT